MSTYFTLTIKDTNKGEIAKFDLGNGSYLRINYILVPEDNSNHFPVYGEKKLKLSETFSWLESAIISGPKPTILEVIEYLCKLRNEFINLKKEGKDIPQLEYHVSWI